mmetsp:Transcript_66192/g.130241  ORF Transcript_66192/g.130241 Transcript_66192/m.130241 type:complete len:365 (+) Transcript_66192:39-1133(+)
MEFTNESRLNEGNDIKDNEESSQEISPTLKGKLNQKSTICGDCTVVEDIQEEEPIAPVDRILLPGDIVKIQESDDQIFIIGTKEGKVTKIRGLEVAKNLKILTLRSCLVSKIEGVEENRELEKLELYDNHIEVIENISHLHNLKVLDLSFNAIREMIPLSHCCPMLEELYLAQNKLRTIQGLEGLVHLRTLDLGANRIRVIQGLETNTAMKSLWLGKNKIEAIGGLEALTELRQLDIQHNRLTTLGEGLLHLSKLEELYLAWNAIDSLHGLPDSTELNTVDLSKNQITSLEGAEQHPSLEELWLSYCQVASFDALTPLTGLAKLTCLYLEHNPLAKDFEYRKTVTRMIPTLQQLDATMVNRTVS